jgi:AraC-like DNA-binding protein
MNIYLPLKFGSSDIFPKQSIAIRPDVHIMMSSGTLRDRLERETGTTAPLFELSYSRKETVYGEVNRTLVELKPGCASLGFLAQTSGHSEYNSGDEVRLYSIWVSPKAFDDFCQAVCGQSNAGFSSFQKGAYHCLNFSNDAREENILNKLDLCFAKETDRLNRLLLESQVLELLSLNIEKLLCKEQSLIKLSKTDIDSLILAREILLNRLESPPSLLELSHMIHMNDCKLKRSFKHCFGQTVYEFVREQRLERAFSLLQKGSCNVSQAAFAIGYTNISHFSQAFRKQFGISPRALRRQ